VSCRAVLCCVAAAGSGGDACTCRGGEGEHGTPQTRQPTTWQTPPPCRCRSHMSNTASAVPALQCYLWKRCRSFLRQHRTCLTDSSSCSVRPVRITAPQVGECGWLVVKLTGRDRLLGTFRCFVGDRQVLVVVNGRSRGLPVECCAAHNQQCTRCCVRSA
jgi:hypothetical protein